MKKMNARCIHAVVDEADDSAQFQPRGGLFLAARIVSRRSILSTFPIRVKRNRPPIDMYHLAEAMMTMIRIIYGAMNERHNKS